MKTIKIYTLSYCPYCIKAKQILESNQIAFSEEVIDDDKHATFDKLEPLSNSRTAPQIFIDGQYFGGCDDLIKAEAAGQLAELFK